MLTIFQKVVLSRSVNVKLPDLVDISGIPKVPPPHT